MVRRFTGESHKRNTRPEATVACFSKTNSFNGNGNVERSDFEPDPNDHRHLATIGLKYVTPAAGIVGKSIARTALAGWSIGSILQYWMAICWPPRSANGIGSYYAGSVHANGAFPASPCISKTSTERLIRRRTSF
jgi:hypothetical protein